MSYNVDNLKESKPIIDAMINGEINFKVKFNELQRVLSKYDIEYNEKILSLLKDGTIKDWFDIANSDNTDFGQSIRKMLDDFLQRIKKLKSKNPFFYRKMIQILNSNNKMTNEEIENYEFPKLNENDQMIIE